MRLPVIEPIVCASLLALPVITFAADEVVLEEVVVTATLRPQSLQDVPSSVTVLDSQTLKDAGQQHFQDVLGLVPNLNASGTASRPRYFQLRGIGEHDQYTPVLNPSVGFIIDDMDFSGIGMPSNLFDMKQVEVLRGPQGTRYGANALAGLIAMRSNDPSKHAEANVEASVADYNTLSLGAVASAPVESLSSAWRLSVQQYQSDGFMKNSFLGRKDTNGRDELSMRFKWHTDFSDVTTVDFTMLHANLDNGYDAWTLDNSRTSLSDKPGVDTQRSTGASLKINALLGNELLFTGTGSFVASDNVNTYDGDWGSSQYFQNLLADPNYVRDQVGSDDRHRETRSLDLRLASNHEKQSINWLMGVYAFKLSEDAKLLWRDNETGTASDYEGIYSSYYRASNLALYAQLDGRFASRWSWSAGLRGEQRKANYDYSDTDGYSLHRTPADHMWGGQASLAFDFNDDKNAYLSLSRGYKAGGFNSTGDAAQIKPDFCQEALLNYELGTKGTALQGRLYFDSALFYEQRKNVQIINSKQLPDSGKFVIYTDNAGTGFNAGIETSVRFKFSTEFEAGGSLGILRSEISTYTYTDSYGVVQNIAAREQAYAPAYNAGLYGLWRTPSGLMARIDVQAKDHFYVASAPDVYEAQAYSVTNIKLGYEQARWDAYLWVMNLFNKDYAVHGFVFKNDPLDLNQEHLYLQKADPRQIGVSGSWKF